VVAVGHNNNARPGRVLKRVTVTATK